MPDSPTTKTPTILAFDTSQAHCAAALRWGPDGMASRTEPMAKGQAERLMPLLEELMAEEGFGWGDLDAIAVGIGPGNFTGIRIGVAAARGLALGLGIPAIGVSAFEGMRGPKSLDDHRPQLVSLPGPRGTNYVQLFLNAAPEGDARSVQVSADGFPVLDLPAGTAVLGDRALDIAVLSSPGYGDANMRASFPATLVDVPQTIARIAAHRFATCAVPVDRPAPLYVRAPDAAPPRDAAPVLLP